MRALAAAVLAALLVPTGAAAGSESSIRCEGGLVSVGDATIDLLGKCGQPALREVRAYETGAVGTIGPGFGKASVLTTERWTYDFGPRQFLMFVTVEGGKVVSMERGGYGYVRSEATPAPVRRATCDSSALKVGDAKIDLLARCGEPALAELRKENVALAAQRDALVMSRGTPRDVEVWTYDFGPQQLVRFVIIADGIVARVDTGSHGYAR